MESTLWKEQSDVKIKCTKFIFNFACTHILIKIALQTYVPEYCVVLFVASSPQALSKMQRIVSLLVFSTMVYWCYM